MAFAGYRRVFTRLSAAACLGVIAVGTAGAQTVLPTAPPKVGEPIENFTLPGPDGKPVELAALAKRGPVVLVVLRGFPGYQCPACTGQFAAIAGAAREFSQRRAQVLFIYPGLAEELDLHAGDFLEQAKYAKLPRPLVMAIDADFKVISKLGLRWDAQDETAYPATFVLDGDRRVLFAKVSQTHGDRVGPQEILAALPTKSR